MHFTLEVPGCQIGSLVSIRYGAFSLCFKDVEEDFRELRAVMLLEAHPEEIWELLLHLGGSDMGTHLTIPEKGEQLLHTLNHLHLVPCIELCLQQVLPERFVMEKQLQEGSHVASVADVSYALRPVV